MKEVINRLKNEILYAEESEQFYIITQIATLKHIEDNYEIDDRAKLSHLVREVNQIHTALPKAIEIIEARFPDLANLLSFYEEYKNREKILINMLFEIYNMAIVDWEEFFDKLEEELFQRDSTFFTTPKQINKLLVGLLDIKEGTLYDGTAGVGGTLIAAAKRNAEIKLFGEEINETIARIAKLKLFILTGKTGTINVTNCLIQPSFIKDFKLKQFKYVTMHFPIGLTMSSVEELMREPYNRFIYGPMIRRHVDLAFLMHGIASIKGDGRGSFLLSGGPLMRGGSEEKIRQNLVASDLIEAVIALPDRMMANTTIPTYILLVNKNKAENMKGKLLFINAKREYKRERFMNKLKEEQLIKIVETYKKKEEIENYSQIIHASELEDNILLPEKYIVDKNIKDKVLGQVRIQENKLKEATNYFPLKCIVSKVYRGLNITASTVKEGEGPLRIIQLSDVENGEINLNHLTQGSLVRDSNIERYKVQKGDLIISNRGSQQKIAIVPEVEGDVILSHNFLGLRLKEGIDPNYLKMYLESPLGQFEISKQQVGSKLLTISPTNMEKVKVYLPENEVELGQVYESIFTNYKEEIKRIERERDEAIKKAYKQAGFLNYMTLKK